MTVTLTCENRACLAAFEYSLKLLRHNFPCMLKVPQEHRQTVMALRSGSAALKPYLESLYPEER
ncbi:hypothetical protein [Serratia ureilytica]|uniref:hypothetical protein n=1 Tax=Serratia ureilytica TaxID=300181 RepID=UPI003712C1B6